MGHTLQKSAPWQWFTSPISMLFPMNLHFWEDFHGFPIAMFDCRMVSIKYPTQTPRIATTLRSHFLGGSRTCILCENQCALSNEGHLLGGQPMKTIKTYKNKSLEGPIFWNYIYIYIFIFYFLFFLFLPIFLIFPFFFSFSYFSLCACSCFYAQLFYF